MEKGIGPAQTYSKTVRGTNLLNQSLCQLMEATTPEKGEKPTLAKRKSARGIRAWTRTSRLWWIVEPVEKSSEFIPLHLLGSLAVRERFHFSYCTLLITPSDNLDASVIPDLVPKANAGPNATANENKSNWSSTASAAAKLFLRGVRDSADAFSPLKSVAGGLCFILETCEV